MGDWLKVMTYKRLKDRRVSVNFKGYPWDHSLIIEAIHSALTALTEVGRMGKDDEGVIRSPQAKGKINRTLELLDKLRGETIISWEEEDRLYDELFLLLEHNMRHWWN